MQPPVQFSRLIDHLSDTAFLKSTPPHELRLYFEDALTLTNFLLTKAPQRIRSIKASIKEEETQLEKKVNEVKVPEIPENNNINLRLAQDLMAKSIRNTREEEDDDFIEKTKAEEEMKLKFYEAENLPPYINWLNSYQKNQRCLHLENEKYRLLVGLSYQRGQFAWKVKDIQYKGINNSEYDLQYYFESNVLPAIEAKHGADSEFYFLSYAHRFLSFINLIKYKSKVQFTLQPKDTIDEDLLLEKDGRLYRFEFSEIHSEDKPSLTLLDVDSKLKLRIFYETTMKGTFEIDDFTFESEEFTKCLSPPELVLLMRKLARYNEVFLGVRKRFPNLIRLESETCFIKNYGQYWFIRGLSQKHFDKDQSQLDGLYLTNLEADSSSSIVIKIESPAVLTSEHVSRHFISSLLGEDVELTSVFMHLILIKFLVGNNSTDSELNDYEIEGRDILYKFSRKFYQEERLRQSVDREENDHSFNNFLLQARINFAFTQVRISCNRHRQPAMQIPDLYLPQSWIDYRDERETSQRQHEIHDVKKVCECIRYEKEHFLMERIYDKKLNEGNKSLFKLSLRPSQFEEDMVPESDDSL